MNNSVECYLIRLIWSNSQQRWAGSLFGVDPTGRAIETSPITKIEGRTVTTRSGSAYTLVGPPRWPEMYPGATESDPLNGAEPGQGFYLAGPGDTIWPAGATVKAGPS